MPIYAKTLIIASRNAGKKREIQAFLAPYFPAVLSLDDIGFKAAIAEEGDSFEANAMHKARTVFQEVQQPVLADDSGLCVTALQGAPGIISARYAGPKATDKQNIDKLLANLADSHDTTAWFECCMVLYLSAKHHITTHGRVQGRIIFSARGKNGFGYDPIFWLPEYGKTMAELSMEQKNQISHRSRALQEMVSRLAEENSLQRQK